MANRESGSAARWRVLKKPMIHLTFPNPEHFPLVFVLFSLQGEIAAVEGKDVFLHPVTLRPETLVRPDRPTALEALKLQR